jgi:precorrin-6B methylase 2
MRRLATLSLLLLFPARALAQRGPDVPNFATPQPVVEQMLRLAGVTKDDVVYDLGCGDGRIVVTAAQKFGARGVGVDLDPNCLRDSAENARKVKVSDRVAWRREDIFKTEIAKATVVALYLSPELNVKLRPRLLKELKPGTRIVAHAYDMGDWKPDKEEAIANSKYKVYVWVVPANVEGEWRWSVRTPNGESSDLIRLVRRYQALSGAMKLNERVLLVNGRVDGYNVTFSVPGESNGKPVTMEFRGTVHGSTMRGNVNVRGETLLGTYLWSAVRK